jgi:hypothetical protein
MTTVCDIIGVITGIIEIQYVHFAQKIICGLLCKVKVKFTLEQAMKAQRGSTGIALLFL